MPSAYLCRCQRCQSLACGRQESARINLIEGFVELDGDAGHRSVDHAPHSLAEDLVLVAVAAVDRLAEAPAALAIRSMLACA